MAPVRTALTRRGFLGALAGLAARPAFAALPSNPAVIIVGAGMAGIAAAHALVEENVSVAVLEARGRVGGRAFAESDTFGVPFDHGCAWLQGGERNPLHRLAARLGFGTAADSGELRVYKDATDLSAYAVDEIGDALGLMTAALEQAGDAGHDVPAATFVRPRTDFERIAAATIGPWEAGVELDQLSVADWHAQAGGDRLVPLGLGNMVAAYAEGLPVRLSTPVWVIDWRGPGVAVVTPDGTLGAKACLVTVPTGVLAEGGIVFDPPLPDRHRAAIDGLPMGLLDRIALQFAPGALDAPPGTWVYQARSDGRLAAMLLRPFGSELAIGLAGGDLARELERAGEAAALDFGLSTVVDLFGTAVRQRMLAGRATRWGREHWSLGAYSAARPGRHPDRAALALPVANRIFFAGEACALEWATQLPGAYLTGRAAARSIVEAT